MSVVANLVVRVSAATTDFEKDLKGLQGKWNRLGSQFQSVGATLTKNLTVPMVGIGVAALKFSTDFETAMTKVQTLSNNSAAQVNDMRKGILALSPAVGKGPQELAEGLLVITSTGLQGAQAMDVLKASAQASAVGLGNITDVARAITAAVTAYGTENLTAARAADILFQTVVEGGAEAGELAGELGRVFGVAQQLGVSFEEVGAFVATYTRLGLNASEATTGLYGALNSILAPSDEAKKALAGIGTSAQQLRDEVSNKGLGEALINLLPKLQAKGGVEAIAAVFGNVRALGGVLGTAGAQAEQYRQILENIKNSTGSLSAAFQVWGGTTAATWAKFTAGAQAALIAIGDQLAPAFSRMLKASMPLIDGVVKLVEWFSKLPQPVQSTALAFAGMAAAAGPLAYLWGTVLKTGAAVLGLMKQLGITGVIGQALAAVTELGQAWTAFGAEGLTTWISGWGTAGRILLALASPITAVVAAVGGLIYLIKELSGSWTTAFTIVLPPVGLLMQAWQQLTAGFSSSKEVFQSIWNILSDLATIIGGAIASAFNSVVATVAGPLRTAWNGVQSVIGSVREAMGSAIAWIGDKLSFLEGPINFIVSKFQWLIDHIPSLPSLGSVESYTAAAAGRSGMPTAPTEPGGIFSMPIGPVQDITAAIALLDQTATKAGLKPGGAAAEKSPLTKALESIHKNMAESVAQARAWNMEIQRQGGLDTATKYAKEQLASALEDVVKQYGSLEAAGVGSLEKVYRATQKVLESTRAISGDATLGAGFTGAGGLGAGMTGSLGGLMAAFQTLPSMQNSINGMLSNRYTSLQDAANQAGMAGAPYVESQGKAIREQLTATIAENAKGVADSVRSAFQYFAGGLSPAMSSLLGGLLNSFEKAAGKQGSALQKFLGGKGGQKLAAGLDIGLGAFGGGFGLGEQFGGGKGALGGAASGALTGAMVAGPFGAVIGGLAGLIGGIFGGKKKHKEELAKMGEAKQQLLEQFGGMDKLQEVAARAGVSVDLLFSTDKAKVFQAEMTKVTDAIKVMQERIQTTVGDIDKVMAKGGLIGKDLWQNILKDADADEIKAKLEEVFSASIERSAQGFNKIATNFELLKAPLSELGVLADAAFAGLIAGGASIPEAIAQMGDGLAHIQEMLASSGQTATGPLADILNFQRITEANQGLFELLSGVDDMLTGLGNSGLLTQERFSALGATISQAFTQLQAQGVAGTTALELMQPQLQKLWEAQQLFGLQTDASTQSLLNQAVQQGIVGENMKGVNEQILDVLKAIAVALGAEIPAQLQVMAGAASTAVDTITPKFQAMADGIHGVLGTIPNHIPIQFDMRLTGELPPGVNGGTAIGGSGLTASYETRIPAMASGGIVTRPTFAMVGEDGPEAVVPLDDYAGGGGTINITVNGTADRAFAKTLAREINRGGDVRTAWEVALR